MRITPEQRPYGPANVITGSNRPDRWPNLFVSRSLPAWIELQLAHRATIGQIQITFDTDMNRHSRNALFRYPDCVKRYDVLVPQGSGWRRVAGEARNYMRRRVLGFDPVMTDRVRLEVQETNGAEAARIYEVRLYGPSLIL